MDRTEHTNEGIGAGAFPPSIDCAKFVEKNLVRAISLPKVVSSVVSRLGFEFEPAQWTKLFQVINRSLIQKQSGHWSGPAIYDEIERLVFCFTFCGENGGEIEAAHAEPLEESLAMFCDNFVSVVVKEPELSTAVEAIPSISLGQWEEALRAVDLEGAAMLVRMLPFYLQICADELESQTHKFDAIATSAVLIAAVHAVVHESLTALTEVHLKKTEGLRHEFDKAVENQLIEEAGNEY